MVGENYAIPGISLVARAGWRCAVLALAGAVFAKPKKEDIFLAQLAGHAGRQLRQHRAGARDADHPGLRLMIVPVQAPLVGDNVFYVQEMAADDPRRVFSQKLWVLNVVPKREQAVLTQLDLKEPAALARRPEQPRPVPQHAHAGSARAPRLRPALAARSAQGFKAALQANACRTSSRAHRRDAEGGPAHGAHRRQPRMCSSSSAMPPACWCSGETRRPLDPLRAPGRRALVMGGIFFRHVLRDISVSTAAVAAVLLVVLLTYQLAFVLGRAADGQISSRHRVAAGGAVDARQPRHHPAFRGVAGHASWAWGACTTTARSRRRRPAASARARSIRLPAWSRCWPTMLAAWIGFVDGPGAARKLAQMRTEALRTAMSRGLAPGQFRALGSGRHAEFPRDGCRWHAARRVRGA